MHKTGKIFIYLVANSQKFEFSFADAVLTLVGKSVLGSPISAITQVVVAAIMSYSLSFRCSRYAIHSSFFLWSSHHNRPSNPPCIFCFWRESCCTLQNLWRPYVGLSFVKCWGLLTTYCIFFWIFYFYFTSFFFFLFLSFPITFLLLINSCLSL